MKLEQVVERLQKLPMPYMRACEVVSDETEDGIAVYANLERRHFRAPLSLPAGIELANGSLDIAYIAAGEDPQSATLARTALTLD